MPSDDLHPINQPAQPQAGYAERRAAQDQSQPYRGERDFDQTQPYNKGAPPAADGKAAAEPGKTVKVGDYELSPDDVSGLLERRAQEDLRKTQIPDSPEAYTATLPEAFRLPDGITFKFDEASPEYLAARNWAHTNGFSQRQFSELLSFHANTIAAQEAIYRNAARAEVEKLGAMGTARVTAIENFLRGTVGEELAGHLRGMLVSAKIVEGFEKLMTKHASQGVATFTQSGRDTPAGNGTIPGYENMSYAQRRAAQDSAPRRGR